MPEDIASAERSSSALKWTQQACCAISASSLPLAMVSMSRPLMRLVSSDSSQGCGIAKQFPSTLRWKFTLDFAQSSEFLQLAAINRTDPDTVNCKQDLIP
jgi:hypothetical protein